MFGRKPDKALEVCWILLSRKKAYPVKKSEQKMKSGEALWGVLHLSSVFDFS